MPEFQLLPPGPGLCLVCAEAHEPEEPHNPHSLYWQTRRQMDGFAAPTWDDALAHVDTSTRDRWVRALRNHGIEVTPTSPEPSTTHTSGEAGGAGGDGDVVGPSVPEADG